MAKLYTNHARTHCTVVPVAPCVDPFDRARHVILVVVLLTLVRLVSCLAGIRTQQSSDGCRNFQLCIAQQGAVEKTNLAHASG